MKKTIIDTLSSVSHLIDIVQKVHLKQNTEDDHHQLGYHKPFKGNTLNCPKNKNPDQWHRIFANGKGFTKLEIKQMIGE